MKLDKVIAVRTDKTIYKDGDNVIKVFNENYSKSDILNEALNHARIEETKLNVPSLYAVTKIEGKWAIVSEYINGDTLEQLMIKNPDKTKEYLDLFVKIQTEILSAEAPMLNSLSAKMLKKIADTDIEEDTKYKLLSTLDMMPRHAKVCHGDFAPENIIIKEDGTPFIIDWAHVTRGNGAADAALTYLLFLQNGKPEMAEAYLDLFCEKTGTKIDYVKRWIPLTAAAQLKRGSEERREFMLRQLYMTEK